MKILVITMQFPHFPAPGGQTRQFFLLKEAAKEHEVTLLTISPPPDQTAFNILKSFLTDVIVLEKKYPYLEVQNVGDMSFGALIKEFFRKEPFEIRKWKAKREIPEFLVQANIGEFDLIQVEHSEVAHWVDGLFPNTPKILVMHNVNYLIYKRFYDIASGVKERFWALSQWLNMRKYETSLSGKFDRYIAMSKEDKEVFAKISPESIVDIIPNGVNTDYFYCNDNTNNIEDAIVYTGYMGWEPSVDAVEFFCNSVFSRLVELLPTVKFYIVGKNPTQRVKNLEINKNVIVTGYVDDVRPFIEKAKVIVVPLRVGGGTRLKILEAMSMGKAVVSTSVGAEGLEVSPSEDIIIADTPEELFDSCVCLLKEEEKRKVIGSRARDKAVSLYGWGRIGKDLRQIYSEMTKPSSK